MKALRIGIVGLGRGFMLTLPALRANPRVIMAGAFDLRASARAQFMREFGTQAYDSLEDLLEADLDAVYIATPHELHATQAIAALDSGKHVLVEKPMAISIADCLAMEAAARRSGKLLLVGPSHGFDAPVRRAAELIARGDLGPVRQITAMNFTDFMYRPRRPEELDSSLGGGVVYSQAAHQIDVVRRLVGRDVEFVRAVAGNWDSGRPSEGAYVAMLGFEGGAVAALSYSGYAHYDSDELVGWISELGRDKDPERYGDARRALKSLDPTDEGAAKLRRTYGEDGASTLEPAASHHEHFGFILVSCERADLKLLPRGIMIYGDERREFLALDPPHLPRSEVIDEFVEGALSLAQPIHDGRWGVKTMACCAALLESSRAGSEVAPSTMIAYAMEDVTA